MGEVVVVPGVMHSCVAFRSIVKVGLAMISNQVPEGIAYAGFFSAWCTHH